MTADSAERDDFVGRVDRIEISRATALYLVAVIEKFGVLLDRLCGQPLPHRLVSIQAALIESLRESLDGTGINPGHADPGTAERTESAGSTVELAQSRELIDLTTAVPALGIQEDSVRKACIRNRLDHIQIGGRYFTTMAAVEMYKLKIGK